MSSFPSSSAPIDPHDAFRGRVIFPEDPEYDEARAIFPGGFDRRPAVIIKVADVADVSRAVTFAQTTGLGLAVRSGGHTSMGMPDDGIVLDLRDLRSVDVDIDAKTVWAGGGLTAAELTSAVAEHDMVIGFGDTGSVGIGGITLSGGIGFLLRKYGMTIDNLLAAEIVTADGAVLEIHADSHPDLFWALRGGGGNFGVVTRFKFRLEILPETVGGILMLPASPDVVGRFLALAQEAPEELSTIANVMPAPPMPFVPEEHHNKLIVMALMTYAGAAEDGQQAIKPFRELATPIVDMVRPMKYAEMFMPEDDSYHPTAISETAFIKRVDADTIERFHQLLEESDATMRVVQLRALGGAMARVAPDATAFAHRDSRIMATVAAFYEGPEDKQRRQDWVSHVVDLLSDRDSPKYVGFLADDSSHEEVRRAYPPQTWERLRAVKQQYDPTNLFRHNHNIDPASNE